jgi:hypothetical protein
MHLHIPDRVRARVDKIRRKARQKETEIAHISDWIHVLHMHASIRDEKLMAGLFTKVRCL